MTNTGFKAMNNEELAMVAGGTISYDISKWVAEKTKDALSVVFSDKTMSWVAQVKHSLDAADMLKDMYIEKAKNTVKGWFTS